jgi:hypothetical protein
VAEKQLRAKVRAALRALRMVRAAKIEHTWSRDSEQQDASVSSQWVENPPPVVPKLKWKTQQ